MPCADRSAHSRTPAGDYSTPATRIILSLRDSGVTAALSRKDPIYFPLTAAGGGVVNGMSAVSGEMHLG
ncbi:MAG TPA: hypothetical protein VKA68_00360 [bacterium]|nr:hypothetical protein [bacterium]